MERIRYETRNVTVLIFGDKKVEVKSDGLIVNGEWNCEDFQKSLDRLNEDGWILVGTVDRQYACSRYGGMDLFFRREITDEA